MSGFHRTLGRQLRRAGIDPAEAAGPWRELLEAVSAVYAEADDERYTLERSLEVSTREMRGLHEVLSRQAMHDTLTGLPNRAALLVDLQARLSAGRSRRGTVAALFIDLDGFKQVNDSLGHAAGDELLVRAAERIRSCLRPDDLVARLGGDEFVVVCDVPDEPGERGAVARIAGRIGAQLATPFRLDTHDAVVSASIGLAESRDGGTDAETLLRRADLAMYDAKVSGKARTSVFDDAMQSDVDARLSVRSALGDAVRGGQLRLHYQPLVSLADGRVLGAEALVRWQRPGHGLLAPDAFVPVAEETALITEVDRWVVGEAVRRAAGWCRAGGSVAVNLSPRSLEGDAVLDALSSALHRWRVPARSVVLEITETGVMSTSGAADRVLAGLLDLGAVLSVDDFGVGHSSLARLRRTRAQVLKVDRSLVADVDRDDASRSVVAAVVAMAHALGMVVVAEGVERAAQADVLRAVRCDQAQGWFFGRPAEPEGLDPVFAHPAVSRAGAWV
ncbi:putative bifunctional diguanylate cyclase/phosphodiesterase [Kineococcus rhizosphaerae]|uniref:Diguanylate cyclase (GGDEF)-like protein n=1 Tax=Kineococcus rhizosphaerae TaxID=559628 RepID=A0A2T0QYS9_9ACTN|nr:EAL domain-containing protein [Kineococcus rhizosphaerae]PRY11506.1 diguanylate cyclase (GGDEF)-like protein [Kineococcus rhizosphaerae]